MCESIVSVLASTSPVDPSLHPVIRPLFEAVFKRLSTQDQDQVWRVYQVCGTGYGEEGLDF